MKMKLTVRVVVIVMGSVSLFFISQQFLAKPVFVTGENYSKNYSHGIYSSKAYSYLNIWGIPKINTDGFTSCEAISLEPTGATIQGWPLPYNFNVEHVCVSDSLSTTKTLIIDYILSLVATTLLVIFACKLVDKRHKS